MRTRMSWRRIPSHAASRNRDATVAAGGITGTGIAKHDDVRGIGIMERSRKRSMKKFGISLALVSSLAVAAYAATTWSQPPLSAKCGVSAHSAMPITAALEQWRCSENHASAAVAPSR